MGEEFENLSSRIPNLDAALAQRIAARNGADTSTTPAPGTFDPYQALLKRKSNPQETLSPELPQWPGEDVKQLADFCQKHGIVGFSNGKMSPIAALAMLKKQVGDYSGVALEDRIPEGYEKAGTVSGYGANYPYSEAMKKKQILHG